MNFKFRITKYLAVSALAVLLLGACSKTTFIWMLPIRTEKKIVAEKRETMTILTKKMHSLPSVLP